MTQTHGGVVDSLLNQLDRNGTEDIGKELLKSAELANQQDKGLDTQLQTAELEVENALGKSDSVSENVDSRYEKLQNCIFHAPDLLELMPWRAFPGRKRACLNKATGMSDRIGVYYEIIPPGQKTSHPHTHSAEDELVFCLQGRGVVWQNGWTYPFVPGDVAGWKAGTGIVHTIINDTRRIPGETMDDEEDLVLLVVGENNPEEDKLFYPFNPECYDVPGCKWDDPPNQNQWGQHSGVARAERPDDALPDVQTDGMPSNVICWKDQLAEVGGGGMSAFATSLSQETGLPGRLGCNLEIVPPGTRSSDPHTQSVGDKLVFIVQGEGSVWLDGQVFPVSPRDAVGFKSGTGLAHTFINDSNTSGDKAGQHLVTLIIGEN